MERFLILNPSRTPQRLDCRRKRSGRSHSAVAKLPAEQLGQQLGGAPPLYWRRDFPSILTRFDLKYYTREWSEKEEKEV